MIASLLLITALLSFAQQNTVAQGAKKATKETQKSSKTPTVYFTKDISSEAIVKLYEALQTPLQGKVALKVHTGEPNAQYFIKPSMVKDIVRKINGTIVESNVWYQGPRFTTAGHRKAIKENGWEEIGGVDILDEDGDIALIVEGGTYLKENYVGKNFQNYDSVLVLSHFKGHAMAGFGGAIKNTSIGIASKRGKAWIHNAGQDAPSFFDVSKWDHYQSIQDEFLASMAEAAKSVHQAKKGKILYINVMNNLSVDCDCSGLRAAAPDMHDIGILASTDPLALDQACIDLVYKAKDNNSLKERIESRNGLHTLSHGEKIGLGSRTYKLETIK
ncbi:MAG: DUF362 domain-containing protein [Treponemataceae bacterium]